MSVSKERSFVPRACCLFRRHQNWPRQGRDCQNLANPSRPQRAPKLHWSCNYYRRFISRFSIVAEPHYELSRKVVSFQWQMEQESAFNELKHRLTIPPVLPYPDFTWHRCQPTPGHWRCFISIATQWHSACDRLPESFFEWAGKELFRDSIRDISSGKLYGPFSLLFGGTKIAPEDW